MLNSSSNEVIIKEVGASLTKEFILEILNLESKIEKNIENEKMNRLIELYSNMVEHHYLN